jgi:hypothetical protein
MMENYWGTAIKIDPIFIGAIRVTLRISGAAFRIRLEGDWKQ